MNSDIDIMQAQNTLNEFIEMAVDMLRDPAAGLDPDQIASTEALLKMVAFVFITQKQSEVMLDSFTKRFGPPGEDTLE